MRITLLIVLLSILHTGSKAQDYRHGPRFGLGLSTQSFGGLFQNTGNLMPGPVLGWHFDLPIHPQMSIMPELLWMTKGTVSRNQTQSIRSKSTYRYLEMPISLKVHMDKNKQDGLFLVAGPSIGYYLNGNYKQWESGNLTIDADYTLPADGQRWQFSGLVGMGMEGDKWSFDVRAQTSFTPLESFTQAQNVVYSITFAYRIAPKPKVAEEDKEE